MCWLLGDNSLWRGESYDFCIAVARDPRERLISAFESTLRECPHRLDMERIERRYAQWEHHARTQASYHESFSVDRIVRIEALEAWWPEFAALYGIDKDTHPRNVGRFRKPSWRDYPQLDWRRIEAMYAKDLAICRAAT